MALSLGSRFLYTGVILDSFKESWNLLFLMALLIESVKSKKQISLFFSMLTGISLAVGLSEGKLFTTFLTVASETHWKANFLINLNLSLILIILDLMIGKTFNNFLHFLKGDIWLKGTIE